LLTATASASVVAVAFLLADCSSSANRAQSYYDSGVKFLAQHDYPHARIEFKNAIKLDRNLVPAWQRLADIDEANQQWGELVVILRTVVSLRPNDATAKLKLATMLARTGSLDEALKLAEAARELDKRNADALALGALINFKREKGEEAVAEAQKALEIDPANSGALIVLAAERLAHGEAKAALEFLDRGAAAHPKDIDILLLKVAIFQQTQDLAKVESVLRTLTESYPEETQFRREMVRLYIFQHRNDEAESALKAIVSANPTDAQAVVDLARFLYVIKGPKDAQQQLAGEIAAGGAAVFPYQMALAQVDLWQGNSADSVKLLESVAKASGPADHILAAEIKLAELHLSKNDDGAAESLVSDILRRDGTNSEGLRLRAMVRTHRGQFKAAVNDLREALDNQSRPTPFLLVLLANAYERDGSMDLAEQGLMQAVQLSNFDARTTLDLVGFLRRRGHADRAENVLTEAADRWPNNVQILSALAMAVSHRDDPTTLQKDASIPSDQEISDQYLGQSLFEDVLGSPGAPYAAAASTLPPTLALINAYVKARQGDRAIAFLKSMLRTNPNDAQTYVLLGSLQLASNEPDQALTSYRTAIDAQPNNSLGYRALSEYYMRAKKFAEAEDVIKAGLQKQPDSGGLHLALGGCLEQTGDYEGAIAEYQRALDNEPGSLVAMNNLAFLLADRRNDRASLDRAGSLAAGLRNTPLPMFKDTQGWVAYRLGDFRTAVSLLEEAAAASPKVAAIHFHLGMAYFAVGGSAKASDQFKLALDDAPDGDLKQKILAALKPSAAPASIATESSEGARSAKPLR
jgi:tetratricopeptide (TPR) repeat protein